MARTTNEPLAAPACLLLAVACVLGWVLDAFDFFCRLVAYRRALTAFEAGLIMLMMIIMWFGPEAKNRNFLNAAEKSA